MSDSSDPVDRALHALAARPWSAGGDPAELERTLMQSFETHTHSTLFARHRVLIPTLAVLALAVGGFAAAGGVNLVRSWFATVTVNGKVVHTGEIVPDENGQATITLPADSLPKDGEKEVSVTLDGDGSAGTTSVTVTSDPNGTIVNMQSQPGSRATEEKK